jgi:hypothetical protein
MRLILRSPDNALSHQQAKTIGQKLARDSEVLLPLLESSQSQERIAQDQQCPAIADSVQSSHY